MRNPPLYIKRLPSGYVRIKCSGVCNWAQFARWPCSDEELEAGFFHEASDEFRHHVREAMRQATSRQD